MEGKTKNEEVKMDKIDMQMMDQGRKITDIKKQMY